MAYYDHRHRGIYETNILQALKQAEGETPKLSYSWPELPAPGLVYPDPGIKLPAPGLVYPDPGLNPHAPGQGYPAPSLKSYAPGSSPSLLV